MQKINNFSNVEKIFSEEYGLQQSIELKIPIDINGKALPLYSYPAIEYIKSLDFSNKEIFEFGAGHSTLFWSQIAKKVTSVENNQIWVEKLADKANKLDNCHINFKQNDDYINFILANNKKYDVIIVDGNENRLKCAKNAIKSIKDDGLIILDNADWFPNSAKLIRDNLNFIQFDFYGFRPSKSNTSVTSFFVSRKSDLAPLNSNKHPNYAIGGRKKQSFNDKI